jgi:hypothetical protein
MIKIALLILSFILILTGCQTTGGTRVSDSQFTSSYQIDGYYTRVQGVYKEYSHNFIPDPTGTASSPNVERIEVRNGDCYNKDCTGKNYNGGSGNYRERTEAGIIPKSGNYGYGATIWYGIDLYIPEESVIPLMRVPTTIVQTMIGKRKSNHPIKGLFNTMTFHLRTNGRMVQAEVAMSKHKQTKLTVAELDDMAGKWTRFEWETHQTDKSDGFVRVYVNGELQFEHKGDSAFDKGNTAQLKYGIYSNYSDFTPEYYAKNPDAGAGTRIIYADNPSMAFKREDLFKIND